MKIGIIGSGRIGRTAARLFADAGHDVAVANSRGPESVREEAERIGARAVEAKDAVADAELVAGDDEEAKTRVAELIREIGFTPVDTGSLREGGRRQQPGTPICNVPLTPAEAGARLAATA